MTVAQRLAWKRFGKAALATFATVAVALGSVLVQNPDLLKAALKEWGVPAATAALILSALAGLLKLIKENRKGLDYLK